MIAFAVVIASFGGVTPALLPTVGGEALAEADDDDELPPGAAKIIWGCGDTYQGCDSDGNDAESEHDFDYDVSCTGCPGLEREQLEQSICEHLQDNLGQPTKVLLTGLATLGMGALCSLAGPGPSLVCAGGSLGIAVTCLYETEEQ